MDRIIALATQLGQEIRGHERYLALREAEREIMSDPAARKIQDDLETQLTRMRDLERGMKPIEVADKRELARLQDAARGHPGLQHLLKAQADYFELMDHVNTAILTALAPPDEASDG